MGMKFRKTIKICNGVKLNISKTGVSLSLGKKGLHYTINSKGKSTATASLPGTGLSYSKRFDTFGSIKSLLKGNKDETEYNEKDNTIVFKDKSDDKKLVEYNDYITSIKSFHKQVSDTIDWKTLANGDIPTDKNDEEKKEFENAIDLAKRVLNKDIDAYLEVMENYSPMEEISLFGSDFEFGSDNPEILNADFNVKIKDVVPSIGFKESNGKINDFELKGSTYNDLAQDYVCSCAIRIAREVFALLPIDICIVNAQDEVFDSSTGNNRDATILSVLFVRSGFDEINFELIDPSDFVGRFKSNVSFTKTNGFKEVKEIEMPKSN